MKKANLIRRIAAGCHISEAQAAAAIDATADTFMAALKPRDRTALSGFGTRPAPPRKARSGRNPRTGEPVRIAAKKVAKVTADRHRTVGEDPFVDGMKELAEKY